jgi:signal peptidase I
MLVMAEKLRKKDSSKMRRPRSWQSDLLSVLVFVVVVAIGVVVMNVAVFRSFSVTGPSMESTLFTKDRLIVNRLPVTWAMLQGHDYVPERGQIIVFENPIFQTGEEDKFIVKRTIAFPGEHVVVKDCRIAVYNSVHPDGFDPYDDFDIRPVDCVSGDVDLVVSDSNLFVIGDNREGRNSLDSRSGLGLIPYNKIIGPVGMQIYPFDKIRFF